MTQIVVDTNVLISFLTDRDENQQKRAADLFRTAALGEHRLIFPQVVLTEMVFVLLRLYRLEPETVAQTLEKLFAMPGIATTHEIPWPLVLDLWPKKIPSFIDAALAAITHQSRYDAVATFDKPLIRRLKSLGLASYW